MPHFGSTNVGLIKNAYFQMNFDMGHPVLLQVLEAAEVRTRRLL